MNVIKLLLKLKSQLDLILMILRILPKLLLQLHSQRLLICILPLQIFNLLRLHWNILLQRPLILQYPHNLTLIFFLFSFNLILLLKSQLRDYGLVIRLAAVLSQDRISSPDVLDDTVFVLSVVQTVLDHLEVTHWVHEQTSVNSINVVVGDASVGEGDTVDTVSGNGIFVRGFNYDVGDVQVTSVF